MTGLELLDFVSKYSPDVTSFIDVKAAEKYFNETVEKGLFIAKYYKGKLVAVLCYYRVPTVESAVVYDSRTDLPENPDKGLYAYVSFVCIHPDYRSLGIMQYFANKVSNLKPPIKAGIWVDPKGSWKIQNRSIDMKSNCGIVAFDQIAGVLNGRSNVISLSTLARIAQDNDFLLYPMKLKRADLVKLKTPFILHSDFHFQTINSQDDLIPLAVPEEVYILAQDINVGEVVDEDEAKRVRGAKKFFKQILAPIAPFISPFITGASHPFQKAVNTLTSGLAGAVSGGISGGPWGALAGGALASEINSYKDAEDLGAKQNINVGDTGGAALRGLGYGALGGGLTSLGTSLLGSGAASTAGAATTSGAGGLGTAAGDSISGAAGGSSGAAFGTAGTTAATGAADIAGSGLGTAADYGLSSGGSTLGSLGAGAATIGSGLGTAATTGIGSGIGGGATVDSTSTGAGNSILNTLGNDAKTVANKFGTQGALGALSLGASLLGSSNGPAPTIPPELDQAISAAQGNVTNGGSTPQGLAASNELTRGINAGVGGIFPAANDQYLQSTFDELDRQAAIQKQNFITTQAKFGRTNSGETIQQLQQMDQVLAKQKQDATLQFQEAQRQQSIGGMQQYLQLASQGDQGAINALITALGDKATAEQAVQAYTIGKKNAQNTTLGTLGTTLLANQFAPQRGA